jgi:uncharacterized membrane protein (UPF0127 family)
MIRHLAQPLRRLHPMKHFARRSSIPLVALLLLIGGCDRPTTQQQPTTTQSLPTVKMKIGGKTFELEIARTSDEQATGLMKRDSMPQDHGMIFVFAEERLLEFWMKDTRIPLDIMYLDTTGKVVSVSQMRPYDLTSISSDVPAQYAIELNAGMVKTAGVKAGDVLTIPTDAKAPDKPATSQP